MSGLVLLLTVAGLISRAHARARAGPGRIDGATRRRTSAALALIVVVVVLLLLLSATL